MPYSWIAVPKKYVSCVRVNHIEIRCNDSLLRREMRAKMTPNVLARSPKTHSNRTINRFLPGRNRALLLHQQTTGKIPASTEPCSNVSPRKQAAVELERFGSFTAKGPEWLFRDRVHWQPSIQGSR
jgi:hypothetical protein